MNIVITDGDTVTKGDLSFDVFRELGILTVYGHTDKADIADRIRGADIVLCNKTPLFEDVLRHANKLRYIGLFATGYNNVDLQYAKSKNITVCNSPGYSTESVAQHVFSLILALYNNTGRYNESVKKGGWIKSSTFSYFPFPICELFGKTIGIVGFGAIGQKVSAVAKAFGMNVLVHTRTQKSGFDVDFVEFDELLRKSDIVTLHCPLTPETENLMDKFSFDKMKKGSVFINTSRGGTVDETALANALVSGRLLGAGVDVLREEPMSDDCVLNGIDNCIITPHVAWAGFETRERLLKLVYTNLKSYIMGNPVNVVY